MQDIVKTILADADNEITTPQFHVKGRIECWVRVEEDGTVSGFEFQPSTFEGWADDLSFARDADSTDDGPSLSDEQVEQLTAHITRESWLLTRVETDEGAVYYDE